jgi:tetratricopeptide (TPR) repeat protein
LAQPPDSPAPALPGSRVRIARQWPWLGAVLVLALVVYLPGMGNLPVFDDALYTDGTLKSRYAELSLRPRAISYGSFVWLDAILGESLWKQRLVNLLLHLGTVAALWAFYREILRGVEPPAPDPGEPVLPYHESNALGLAIAFFALNPVAVYAVAYLIQRSILMATLFVVLGLWLFARGLRTRQWWLHLGAALCYGLAVASKENALLAPLIALPVYVIAARPTRGRLAIVAASGAVLLAIAVSVVWKMMGNIFGQAFDEFSRVYLAQLATLNADAPRHAYSLSIENQAWLFFAYGLRWFLPVADWMSISMRPPFPTQWWSFPHVLGPPLYIAVIVVAARLVLRYRDWRALAGFSLLVPALLFASEFATVWVQDPFVLYRSYLWAVGVPGLVLCFVHGTSTRALAVVFVVVSLLLSWQAVERVLSLANPESAWTDAIGKLSNDPRAVGRWFPYLNRGSYYVDHDQFQLAMRDFEVSSTLGDLGIGAFNTGSLLNASGKPRQALAMFDRAEKQGYDLYSLPFQRGLAYAAMNRPQEAYREFATAAALNPPPPTSTLLLLPLGRAALQTGKQAEAIGALTRYLQAEPGSNEARYLLAMAHVSKGENEAALEALKPAAEGGAIHYARALAYHGLGRKADATREIDTAIRMGPVNPAVQQWQAKIHAMR